MLKIIIGAVVAAAAFCSIGARAETAAPTLCITFTTLFVNAAPCPAPQCHPAVRIEDTWRPDVWSAEMPRIVTDQSLPFRLVEEEGWQWVGVRDDQPLWVCLTNPKQK